MNENEAIDLLGKLKSFMDNTNKQISTLINKTHNLEIEIENIKKEKKIITLN